MACDFCGSDKYDQYLKCHDVNYVKCSECELVYQYPVLSQEEINDIYSSNYFEYEVANHENFFHLMKLSLQDVNFEELAEKLPSKNVLDIGCATGLLLNHLKGMGFHTTGVEICEASADYAINTHGLNVHKKPLEEVGFEDESFSVVHLSHLIEHVPSPSSVLKEIHRILQKDGYMILTTPNEEGMFSRIYKEHWRSAMPQHLHIFGMKNFVKFVKSIGFDVVQIKSWGSIPVEKNANKSVKKIVDKMVKVFNIGDVMLLLCVKR